MRVIYKRLPSKKRNCVATIGVFDGVHCGHQFILRKVKKRSQELDCSSLVITFDTLPQQFFNQTSLCNSWQPRKPFYGYLTNLSQKISFIESLGIQYLWFLKTKQSLLELPPKDFFRYICRYFTIKELIVGQDFRFGYGGKGDVKYLKNIAEEYKFRLSIVQKRRRKTKIISSSLIRQYIREGQIIKAKQFLGRNFSLQGKILKGRGFGWKLGFPTANIFAPNYVIPAAGVYAAYVILGRKFYLSAVNIGIRPTLTRQKKQVIEAHLINFHKNILGKRAEIVFLKRLRDEKKFPTLLQLKAAISRDIEEIISKYSTSQ